ncbi:MAG: autotransporter domain-containing protein [Candidatus Spyradosoma sp.]
MKSHRRSLSFFNSAAGVPAFLLAAAALGISAAPAHAANVAVLDSDGIMIESGQTVADVFGYIESGCIVRFGGGTGGITWGETLRFLSTSEDSTLTLESEDATVRTVTGTADFFRAVGSLELTLKTLVFDGNLGVGYDAHQFAESKGASVTIVGDAATIQHMENETMSGGGAIYAKTDAVVSGTTFKNNEAAKSGGAVAADGNVSLSGETNFSENVAWGLGGAVYAGGNVSVSGTATFTNNVSVTAGGAICAGGDVEFSGDGSAATFSGNRWMAAGCRNDVCAGGDVVIRDAGTYSFGGGVVAEGGLTISGGADVAFGEGSYTKTANALTLSGATLRIAGGNTTTFEVGGGITLDSGTTNFVIFEVGDYQLDADGSTLLLKGDASALAGTNVMSLNYTGTLSALNIELALSADENGVTLTENLRAFTLSRAGGVVGYADTLAPFLKSGASVSVASGDVITVYGNDENGEPLKNGETISFTDIQEHVLTLKSSDAGTPRTIKGTQNFFSSGGPLTLNLTDLVFDGDGTYTFAQSNGRSRDALEIVGDDVTIRNMKSALGGALYSYGSVSVEGTTTFTGNSAASYGGAICSDRGNVSVAGTTKFANNTAGNFGGAIFSYRGNVAVSGKTTFANNTAGSVGGAICSGSGGVSVSGTTKFENNSATAAGGAIYTLGTLEFSGDGSSATFSGNTAGGEANDVHAGDVVIRDAGTYAFGGGVVAEGGLTISGGADVTFGAGSTTNVSGALTLSDATLTIAGGNTTVFTVGGGVALGSGTNALVFEISDAGQIDADGETLLLRGDASALAGTGVMRLESDLALSGNGEFLLFADSAGVVLKKTEYAFTLSRGNAVVGYGNDLDFFKKEGMQVFVESGDVIKAYKDGSNSATLGFWNSTELTIEAAGTSLNGDARRTVTGTADFFAAYSETLRLNLKNLVFDGNDTHRFVYAQNCDDVFITGDDATIQNMRSFVHGAIYAERGNVSVSGTISFTNNTSADQPSTVAESYGGAIYAAGNVSVSGKTTFTGNSAENLGGAIYAGGNVEFSGDGSAATFSGNTIDFSPGTSLLIGPNDVYAGGDVVVRDAGTYAFGGGIYAEGGLTISDGADVAFGAKSFTVVSGDLTLSGATLTIAGGRKTHFLVNGVIELAAGTTNSVVFEVGDDQIVSGGTTKLLSGDASALAGTDVMMLRYTGTAAANVERLLSADAAGVWLSEGAAYPFTLSRDGAVVGYGNTLEAYTNSGASVSVESGDVITVYADGGNAGTIGLSGDATLTVLSDSDAVRKVTGTENFFSTSSGTLTLNLKNLVFDGNNSVGFTHATTATLEIAGENVTIQNMFRQDYGGAINADRAAVSISGSVTFTDNEVSTGYGGAIYMSGNGRNLTISISGTTTFTGNKANAGGAIFVNAASDASNVTISGTTKFEDNSTRSGGGGAICVDGKNGSVIFSGDGSEATFTGNITRTEVVTGVQNTPNDVQASTVVITDAGTYSFDGGIVASSLTISDGADVTFKGGAINSVSVAMTISGAGTTVKFENAGEGASNDVKNWTDDAASAVTLGAGTKLVLTSDASATTIRSALTLGGDLVAGTLDDEGNLANGETLVVARAIANGAGTISAKNVSLNGLYGATSDDAATTSVTATETLELGGETKTTGTLTAQTIKVLSGASLTADFSKISVGGTLTVEALAKATLNADAPVTLGNLAGAGTVEKTGAGALTLGAGNDAFTGTLKISAGAATLRDGATFGGSLGFFSEGKTLTAHDGATIAGTLTLGAGTTLELGGRDAKATVSVGALATGGSSAQPFSVRALSSAGTATIVHDVYSATEYDVLRVGAGADLSSATALLRAGAGLDVSALASAPDGVTLTLVEGDVAHGYGALQLADEFVLANFALSADGTTASVGLGANALAAGIFPLETTADQRAVAQAATRAGTASLYGAALNALTNPHETLAALDALGAGHAAAMMPAQIDGTWNRLRGVMNAAGTGARLGAETELAAWAQYVGSYTDVDSSRERASWTRRMHGAHVGVERAFASGWTAGAALGYEDSEQKIGGAKIEDDALSASFYARRTQGAFTQTAALSFARHDYETRRTVAFPGYAGRTSGDTHGFTAALSYEASYAFEVADWVKLSPTAGLSAAWNTIEGWTESGADAALRCDDQDAFTVLAGVGGRADFEFENPFADGTKTRVGAYALFTAEMGDRSCGVDAAFTDTGAGFTARYDDPSRYALQLGVTASLPLSGNTALFGGLSTELREDETNLNANLGVRFTW